MLHTRFPASKRFFVSLSKHHMRYHKLKKRGIALHSNIIVTIHGILPSRYQNGNNKVMDLVNVERIKEFAQRHPRAVAPLQRWQAITNDASWDSFQSIKATFKSADYVAGKVVFNIGGNKYRLISVIDYQGQQVIIRAVLTHPEYDEGKWKR